MPRPRDGRARLVPPGGRAQSALLAALGSARAEARPVKRALVALAVLGALAVPAVAAAHPLGNFTTNHYSRVVASGDRIYVLYVLDLAEIPTFQEKPTAAKLAAEDRARDLAAGRRACRSPPSPPACPRLPARCRRACARPGSNRCTASPRLRPGSHRLEYRDDTFPGRVGWKEVVVQHDSGARVDSTPADAVGQRRAPRVPEGRAFQPARRALCSPLDRPRDAGRERRPSPRRARSSTRASPSTRAATAGSRVSSRRRS